MSELRDDASAQFPGWDGDCFSAARDREARQLGSGEPRRRLGGTVRGESTARRGSDQKAETESARMGTARRPGLGRRQR